MKTSTLLLLFGIIIVIISWIAHKYAVNKMEKHRLFEFGGEIITPINSETINAKKISNRSSSWLFIGVVLIIIGLITLMF
jgi:hypothetical protein